MSLKNPYSSFLDTLEKPARYIGGEHLIIKKDWAEVVGTTVLCFPDTYEIGMSHLGMKVLYDEINRHPDLLAERCFAPWVDMEKQMRERKLPLVSLENFKTLSEFEVVGFSLQYEMSYTNILNMLDLGGIPIWQKDRKESDSFVICGGPCATHPEPLAPFMDFVVIGDGEEFFSKILRFIGLKRKEGVKRELILLELAKWQGIYVPSLYQTKIDEASGFEYVSGPIEGLQDIIPSRIKRYFIQSLKNYDFPVKTPIPHMTAIFDRFSVELSRGCTEGCRFCQAGMIYRPVRERAPENVTRMVMDGVKTGGFDEASLTCLSTADYSAVTPLILDLLEKLSADKSTLGISSLRAYGLDEKILDKLAEVKNSSLTFAPEAGSQRMRNVINKNISEEDLMKTAENVFSRGWSKMKLYFMIGLPTEDDSDVVAIMETGKKARDIGKYKCGIRKADVTVSASSFVPKPHTPFQWAPMISLEEIVRKQNMLWELAREYGLTFRKHYSKISFLEGIVSRGDRRVANIIYAAWKGGARFDGWDETFKYDVWVQSVEESGIDVNMIIGTIPLNAKLPWDHIDVGLQPRFLDIEWKKALSNRLSPPCGKVAGAIVHDNNLEALEKKFSIDKKKLVCYHCGIKCDLKQMVDNRRDFLTTMKSIKDVPYERPEKVRKSIADSREKRNQKIGFKYRVEFSKIGPISFISHLDLQKIMSRIFKRAEVTALHSEGFKTRPLISFGPALTLGISSLTEYFDVRVETRWENPQEVLNRLQFHSEKGIIFKNVVEVAKKTPSIQESAKFFTYFVPVHNPERISAVVSDIEGQERIEIQSYSKSEDKHIVKDIRPFFHEFSISKLNLDATLMNIIDEVSPCKDLDGLYITTKVEQGASVRPSEIIACLKAGGLKVDRPIKVSVQLFQ